MGCEHVMAALIPRATRLRRLDSHRRWACALVAASLAVACAPEVPSTTGRPLVDRAQPFDVLVETRRIDPAATLDGNRFVRGWRPWRRQGVTWLLPDPAGARLEIVNVQARPRVLVLRTEVLDPFPADAPEPPAVRVSVSGTEIGRFPLTSPLEVTLPPLPLGRVAIDFHFPETPRVTVAQARLRRALEVGAAAVQDDGSIAVHGHVRVELVRRATVGSTLVGGFVPEKGTTGAVRLTLDRGDGPRVVFDRSLAGGDASTGLFEVPVEPSEAGLVRMALHSEGASGVWQGLGLRPAASPGDGPGSEGRGVPDTRPRLVVLYVLDALRADFVSHLGGPGGLTPTLDRLAAEGATFVDHQSVAPNTLPSTKALFTGRTPRQRGGWILLEEGPPTLAETLATAGFATGLFSDNPYVTATYGLARGFAIDASEAIQRPGLRDLDGVNDSAERVHAEARGWLEGLGEGTPAFAYLHSLNPHNPYTPPEPFPSRVAPAGASSIDGSTATLLAVKAGRVEPAEADRARLRRLYASGLAYNDHHLGALLAWIESRYAPGEALVIVTADHGDELFEHGGVLHGYTLYQEQLHVPLIVWWPGQVVPGPRRVATDALDLHATLRSLAGDPGGDGTDRGRSLWPVLVRGPAPDAATLRHDLRFAAASSLDGGIFSVRGGSSKLIWAPRQGTWGQGEARGRSYDPVSFFDLEGDPNEQINLAGGASLEESWLGAHLRAWVEAGWPRDEEREEPPVDDETRARLRALGYAD